MHLTVHNHNFSLLPTAVFLWVEFINYAAGVQSWRCIFMGIYTFCTTAGFSFRCGERSNQLLPFGFQSYIRCSAHAGALISGFGTSTA